MIILGKLYFFSAIKLIDLGTSKKFKFCQSTNLLDQHGLSYGCLMLLLWLTDMDNVDMGMAFLRYGCECAALTCLSLWQSKSSKDMKMVSLQYGCADAVSVYLLLWHCKYSIDR